MQVRWLGLALVLCAMTAQARPLVVDVCVYGGTSAGVIAAYTAARYGHSVVLIEPGRHLGGMSSGGLGATDIGNKSAITGLGRDFYKRLGKHYRQPEQWTFEPHVAEAIFNDYVREGKVPVHFGWRIVSARKQAGRITSISLERSDAASPVANEEVQARVFIDCSYEGDLMARAGVSYTVGRESNAQYNERYNGVQFVAESRKFNHQLVDGVDPYVVPGDSTSGLLPLVSASRLLPNGTGDRHVQAYTYRLCLTTRPDNRLPIMPPPGYSPAQYELYGRWLERKGSFVELHREVLRIVEMPNGKTDINNHGGVSTDFIGGADAYPEASYAVRDSIARRHEYYQKGLLYFLQSDPRVPDTIRVQMRQYGYAKDEFRDTGGWPHQLYVREARRMVGTYVMTEHDCLRKTTFADSIGQAAYTMDAHNAQRVVWRDPKTGQRMVKNEGDVQVGGFPPYPISYRAIVPRQADCQNLLVPVCLSASHIAYGSIRMEPVFMVLGQAAGVAASFAIRSNKPVQQIDAPTLQRELRQRPLAEPISR